MIRLFVRVLASFVFVLMSAAVIGAQDPPAGAPQGAAASPSTNATTQTTQDDDAALKLAEPEFTLVSLPTSLRLPKFKSAFRVTHRFTRPLNCDACPNSIFGDAFGIDNGALIGLEYRIGIVPNGQIGIHRTQDKTVEIFGQYGVLRQNTTTPVAVSALAAIDITNVGRRDSPSEYSPTLGVIVSRLVGDQAAVYLEPMWVHHSNLFQKTIADDNTFMIGLGARIRVSATVYVVGEFTPRVSGYDPGTHQGGFAIEKRAGGHMFQLNFSNAFGTTLSQIARGAIKQTNADGTTQQNWYLGFNISRKFF